MVNVTRIGPRIRKTFQSHHSSYPYLSGDTFKLVADFHFSDLMDFQARHDWQDVKIVFCKSESLESFLTEKPSKLVPKVLICGNSDFDFHSIDEVNLTKVKALFLQNSFISDNKRIFTLPIGLENARYESNGRVSLYSKRLVAQKSNSILVGPFGDTHIERKELNHFYSDPLLYCVKKRVSTRRHLKNIDSHKFVACPRGNGIDTHRVWETLYRGSIPILVRNSWSESLHYLGLNIQIIDKWSDLRSVMDESISLNPNQVRNNPKLWMHYWERLFATFI